VIKRVKLDENGWLTELDWKAIQRVAFGLKDYIKNAPLDEIAKYQYHTKALPFVESIICNKIILPFRYQDAPYETRYQIEGLFPMFVSEFSELYSKLLYMLSGSIGSISLSTHETGEYILEKYREVDANGNIYELCWFED
jgi:hypothetical protein